LGFMTGTWENICIIVPSINPCGWQSCVRSWNMVEFRGDVCFVWTSTATYGCHWSEDEGWVPSCGRMLGNHSEERNHMDQNMNWQVNMVYKNITVHQILLLHCRNVGCLLAPWSHIK
jgi:hypothetical protein